MSTPALSSPEEAAVGGGEPLLLHRPGTARVHDFFLGGKDNYAADRDLAHRILRVLPRATAAARGNRAFLARAVRTLAGRGIRQFVDLGCGLPTSDNVHQMAARHISGTRVLYVDHDPLVIAHARALLVDDGNIAALRADLREPAAILGSREMRRLIDPAEPVALILSCVLHFLPDPSGPVAALTASAAPGSALVISHATADFAPVAVTEAARLYRDACATPLIPRPAAELERLFAPFRLLDPGITPAAHWHPDLPPRPTGQALLYAGVAIRDNEPSWGAWPAHWTR
ncbi:SAM-dependent methyltransferase [Actinomadura rubrisoli]|uniref:SAM-dependent methyltransferase n=1 Tax=Actinomadura rubrisoli TaxID=2530368 RepID=A0A4R5BQ06_9ACTN|nr:SAM-dependent methyltransferase [Actinomadura rubrisoli]TDD88025.1 SAM-dependent methyltransferase [Actinomadura rubrisoli]